jgi:ribosomal protein S18 acetylase RimI-like enzyme
MADKKIYRRIKGSTGDVVSIFDSHTNRFIPADEDNADYAAYLVLLAQGKALLLDDGEALPGGVTDADVKPDLPLLGVELSKAR